MQVLITPVFCSQEVNSNKFSVTLENPGRALIKVATSQQQKTFKLIILDSTSCYDKNLVSLSYRVMDVISPSCKTNESQWKNKIRTEHGKWQNKKHNPQTLLISILCCYYKIAILSPFNKPNSAILFGHVYILKVNGISQSRYWILASQKTFKDGCPKSYIGLFQPAGVQGNWIAYINFLFTAHAVFKFTEN